MIALIPQVVYDVQHDLRYCPKFMTPTQCRMARAALGWSIRKLAAEAGLASNTVLAFERGRSVLEGTWKTLRATLAAAGFDAADENLRDFFRRL